MSLTRDLIRLIRAKPVGRRDLERAALLVLDAAANFIAGAQSDPGRRLLGWRFLGRCENHDRTRRWMSE